MGVDLLLEQRDFLLRDAERIGPGDEATGQILLAHELEQRLSELGGVARLFAILRLPESDLLRPALIVVLDQGRGVVRRLLGEKFGAEEAWIDRESLDAERLDFGL